MEITLFSSRRNVLNGDVEVVASKSIASRHLLIRAIAGEIPPSNLLSDAEDTQQLHSLLSDFFMNPDEKKEYNAGAGGTTFRFLTAFFASQSCNVVLSGSQRMCERPVGELVNALRQLGADIRYLNKEGFPPITISGKKLKGGQISINSSISSQFISALMMVAPTFSKGLELQFSVDVVSRPYINMTAEIMRTYGVQVELSEKSCYIPPANYSVDSIGKNKLNVEGDWSSASYFYSLVALSDATELTITNLKEKSIQPDSYCVQFFRLLGVETEFKREQIRLRKTNTPSLSTIEIDCSDCPDLAQALAVVCSAKKIPLRLFGLSTLRMKETDRISALQKELYKFGVLSEAGNDFLFLNPENFSSTNPEVVINTYDDHRMAMCFAPLAFLRKKLRINNPDVVKKSFPDFWNVLKKIGIQSKRG